MTVAAFVARVSLSRQSISAGPVVGVLVLLTLVAVLGVLAVAYVMHLKDRR